MTRARTYSWVDPHELTKAARDMTGLEFTHHLLSSGERGRMPMATTLGFRLVHVERGHVVFESEVGEHLYNPIGSVHGGLAATLLDSAAGSAIHTLLPAGWAWTTLDLSVHFLRPVSGESGALRAIGSVVNSGRRTALGEGELRDSRDRLLAHATSSLMLFPPEG